MVSKTIIGGSIPSAPAMNCVDSWELSKCTSSTWQVDEVGYKHLILKKKTVVEKEDEYNSIRDKIF